MKQIVRIIEIVEHSISIMILDERLFEKTINNFE